MKSILYWFMVVVLGSIHIQALPWKIPFYVGGLAFLFYSYRIIILHLPVLGFRWNSLLWGLQLLLLLLYIPMKPLWVNLVPFIVFIVIEVIRVMVAGKLASLQLSVKQMEEQATQLNETFRVVRSERHDFLKHVSAVHFMLEKGDAAEAKAYLDDLVDDYEETNLSIKGERGSVAGVLHQMYKRAKAAGIEMVYDFDLPLSSLPVSDQQMVGLFGNLLSNSIEACEEWQKERKEQAVITLQFYKRSGLYLLICKNNSLPIPTAILDELFHSYGKTTKGGEHQGLGTKMIHDTVKACQGFLDFIYKDQEFTVKIKIPAIQK
ncbi:sensor histidine kinase [Bacillus sp. FJAT-29814]|uniref:sensor histidine kinase n=1 Tax=Bacillus sp. FJAT-29814 TaxID=1729688 RepID=UPI000AD99B9A|nr:GHKL domain-containing protein [Bacillus sp. FJAT-29814]